MNSYDDIVDEREDDDMCPAQTPVLTMCLGDNGSVDATIDGTLLFTDEDSGRSVEIGFANTVQVMRLLREVAWAGEEVASLEARQRRNGPKPTARPSANHPTVFSMLTEGVVR